MRRGSSVWLHRAVALFATAFLLTVSPDLADAAARRGQPAPSFRLFAINGQPVSSEGLKGSVVIIDFWATWCPPCRQSLPFLNELHNKYGKQGLQIIGMSVDEGGERTLKPFVAEQRLAYSIVAAPKSVQDSYGVRALPVLFVLNKQGTVVEQMLGFSPAHGQLLEQLVKKLLRE